MTGDKERETSEDRGSTRHSGRQTIKGKRVKRDIRRAGHHHVQKPGHLLRIENGNEFALVV